MGDVPKISVRGLKKSFGPKLVLDGIDLDITAGESMVVIGGSGTGKSVMVKCILGLLEPDAGSIKIDGQEVVGMPTSEREKLMQKFGMLFQGAALFDSLPVWENVAFALIQGRGLERQKAKEIALAKLANVGLGPEVGELRPSELSGGMQKRVGLARAIAIEPVDQFVRADPFVVRSVDHPVDVESFRCVVRAAVLVDGPTVLAHDLFHQLFFLEVEVRNVVDVNSLRPPLLVHRFGKRFQLRLRWAAVVAHQHNIL